MRDADLNDYLYFAEAVAHGGFAAASRVLNIPKSKLSRRIAGLENRLGVRLIERSTRHFRVTDLGRSFYERCRAILEVAEDAEAIVAEARREPKGVVRFSCPTGLLEIVTPTLPPFLSEFPKVSLQMHATDRAVDLAQDEVDLAIRVRTELDSGAALTMRSLGISRKILVANKKFTDAVGGDIDELANLPTLSTTSEPGKTEWTLLGSRRQIRKIRHEPRVRCGDFATIRDSAAQGLGIALLPDHTCREYLDKGKLVRVFPEWHSPDGFVHVVFTGRTGLPLAVRAFIDHLVSVFATGVLSSQENLSQIVSSEKGVRNGHVLVGAV